VCSGFPKRSCSIKNREREGDSTKSHRVLEGWSETMAGERQKGDRVTFERGIPAHMMGIDGTWRRDCRMEDVSETGAKLTVEGSVEGLHLKEFFLLLSSTGLAYRRCELSWVNGDQIGVNFLKQGDKKKKAAARRAAQEA
jgi:hypothetical protein